jgi:hypothetical protein
MRVEKVLAILIESGLVYCFLWVCFFRRTNTRIPRVFHQTLQILYLVSAFRVFPEPFFTVMDAVLLFVSVSTPDGVRFVPRR